MGGEERGGEGSRLSCLLRCGVIGRFVERCAYLSDCLLVKGREREGGRGGGEERREGGKEGGKERGRKEGREERR